MKKLSQDETRMIIKDFAELIVIFAAVGIPAVLIQQWLHGPIAVPAFLTFLALSPKFKQMTPLSKRVIGYSLLGLTIVYVFVLVISSLSKN